MRYRDLDPYLAALRQLRDEPGDRVDEARRIVALIRKLGPYRWAGLYDVHATEIAVIAWDGPAAPAYPRFPVTRGLNGACVSSGRPVIVQDVAHDARYLTTIGGTRGEMIQPVMSESGVVVGTIDVESERVNAFSSRDEVLLAAFARNIGWLWPAGRGSITPAIEP
jgi:L-methionine (R)-S-oxide reductase